MLTLLKKRQSQILLIFLVGFIIGISFGLTCLFKIPAFCTDPDGLSIPAKIFAKTLGLGGYLSRGPAYPFLLGIVYYIFGVDNLLALIIFQTICFALLGTIVYRISLKSFANNTVAVLSALTVFINPIIFWYIPRIWVELPFALFVLIMINMAQNSIERPSIKNLVLFGVTTAVAALCKPVTILFPLFLGISLVTCYFFKYILIKHFSKLDLVKFIFVPTVCMLITLSPWTIRNKIISGKFILVAPRVGIEFCRGTVYAEENSFLLQQTLPQIFAKAVIKERQIIEKHGLVNPTVTQLDDVFNPIMIDYITHSPHKFALKILKQIPSFWYRGENTKKSIVFALCVLLFLPLFVGGFVKLHKKYVISYVVLIFIVYMNLLYAATIACARYSMPIYPLMSIIAIPFVGTIFKKFKN